MDDLERYSDYNDYGDDEYKSNSHIGLILKILIAVVCVSVVGLIAFRLIVFNYYPEAMKTVYFNEKLTDYYEETNGQIGAKTQNLRAEYDDPDEGNFFADNLIVIPGINQIQVSLRFNTSLVEDIEKKYGVKIDPDDTETFSFSLAVIPLSKEDGTAYPTGELSVSNFDSRMMYRYYKLVFDDVDLKLEGEKEIWIRLEIRINGIEMEEPFMILIYEDTEEHGLEDYVLSSKEHPGD